MKEWYKYIRILIYITKIDKTKRFDKTSNRVWAIRYVVFEFTFHKPYLINILELVSCTMIFWTELSCWCQCCLSKAMLLLGWSHHSKNYPVIVTKYPYLKWQWIFCFLCIFFVFPLTPTIPLSNLSIYMSNMAWVL